MKTASIITVLALVGSSVAAPASKCSKPAAAAAAAPAKMPSYGYKAAAKPYAGAAAPVAKPYAGAAAPVAGPYAGAAAPVTAPYGGAAAPVAAPYTGAAAPVSGPAAAYYGAGAAAAPSGGAYYGKGGAASGGSGSMTSSAAGSTSSASGSTSSAAGSTSSAASSTSSRASTTTTVINGTTVTTTVDGTTIAGSTIVEDGTTTFVDSTTVIACPPTQTFTWTSSTGEDDGLTIDGTSVSFAIDMAIEVETCIQFVGDVFVSLQWQNPSTAGLDFTATGTPITLSAPAQVETLKTFSAELISNDAADAAAFLGGDGVDAQVISSLRGTSSIFTILINDDVNGAMQGVQTAIGYSYLPRTGSLSKAFQLLNPNGKWRMEGGFQSAAAITGTTGDFIGFLAFELVITSF